MIVDVKIFVVIFWLLATIGCGSSTKAFRSGAVVAAALAVSIDWCQTRSAAKEGWSEGRFERGVPARWVIGDSPSRRDVDVYFAVSAAVLVAATQAIPERWRSVIYGAVVVGETAVVVDNLPKTSRRCL